MREAVTAKRTSAGHDATPEPSAHQATLGESRYGELLPDQRLTPIDAPSWSFAAMPVRRAPQAIQCDRKTGMVDDPLEHEAESVARRVLGMHGFAGTSFSQEPCNRCQRREENDEPSGRQRTPGSARLGADALPAVVGDVLNQRGSPLDLQARGFFETRFGHDFGHVRVHTGPDASRATSAMAARAWTFGNHIAFGKGMYSPTTREGLELIAHELTHVLQQGAGSHLADARPRSQPGVPRDYSQTGAFSSQGIHSRGFGSAIPVSARHGPIGIQRSPLSDSVKAEWTAEPVIEALLARLSDEDIQTAQNDTDVDAELGRILADRPDDLWVAQRVRQGRLGQTTGAFGPRDAKRRPVHRPIEAFFFRGSTDRRALVIAGVHGTERQGMEVARMLLTDLKAQQPVFTVIVVPSLFPDNAARGKFGERESGDTPTNRNFPLPTEDLAAARRAGRGTAVDATVSKGSRSRAILPENLLLLELIERFHPERIISIHGTSAPGQAGVFYDPRTLQPSEIQLAREWAAGNAYMRIPPDEQESPEGQKRLRDLEERLFHERLAQLMDRDRELSSVAATQIDVATRPIPGREARSVGREKDNATTTAEDLKNRRAHPSIAGNVGKSGAISNFFWGGSTPGGTSLGGYAPPRGISVFTVEPPIDRASTDYPTKLDQVTTANRRIELQAYAEAVRTILLGNP
jgi:hypothetical protein